MAVLDVFSYAAEAALVGLGYLAAGVVTRAIWEWIGR